MSEAELYMLRARLIGGLLNKARRGDLWLRPPIGFVDDENQRFVFDPDVHASSRVGMSRRLTPVMAEKFVIQGGEPLTGEITAAGNKNAALPILAACLLTEEELPPARTCRGSATRRRRSRLLEGLGVEAEWVADNELRLQRRGVTEISPDEELSARIRASFLLAGPLLARFGEARMPPPGGDFIGRRRLDPHLDAFRRHRRRDRGHRWIELNAPDGGLKPCADLHGRAVGDGHRERADGRGADPGADDDPQRRFASRTSRTSPACW